MMFDLTMGHTDALAAALFPAVQKPKPQHKALIDQIRRQMPKRTGITAEDFLRHDGKTPADFFTQDNGFSHGNLS